MFRKLRSRKVIGSLLACMCLPMMVGLSCVQDGAPVNIVTLVDETYSSTPITKSFAVSAANKLVTVVMDGNVTASRIDVAVYDPLSVLVAFETNPTSSRTETSFISTTAGTFNLQATDVGGSTLYTLVVTEQ